MTPSKRRRRSSPSRHSAPSPSARWDRRALIASIIVGLVFAGLIGLAYYLIAVKQNAPPSGSFEN